MPVTDVRDSHPSEIKSRFAGAVLALITLALFAVANLPYQYVESEVEWIGYLELTDGGSYRTYHDFPIMAGWPLQYLIRYVDGDDVQDRLWLPARLAVNVGLGILVAAGVYLFMQFRRRKLIESSESQRVRLIFDCGVAFAILVVPGSLFIWQYRATRHDLRLARSLDRVGSSCVSCWLPAVYSELVPAGLKRSLVRVRQVHVYGAGQETVEQITSVPTLAAYHCYGGQFDAKPLEKLLDNPHFCVLQLNRRDLSEADLAVMQRFRWLEQLQLAWTSLNTEQLQSLGQLQLKVIDLSFTNVELSGIGKPQWSSTLEVLSVSRPRDGVESSLIVEGWPKLKRLQIRRQSTVMNDAVMSIRLVDLPRLKRLQIDRVQKHDLVIRNVPRLTRIDEGVSDSRYASSDVLRPGLTWVRSLEIDGADSLTNIGCYAKDLEHFSIRRTPNLRRLSIGSYLSSFLGEIRPQSVDPEQARCWIKQVGATMDGPAELDLSFLPLATNDLSPLRENEGIRHLYFNGTGVTFPQVQQLAGLDSLESLTIPSTKLKQDDLAWLLDQFPNLRDLSVDVNELSNFELEGRDRLRELRITPMGSLAEIRVVDLPLLRTAIRLTQSPKKLTIRNVPSLRGLAIEGPWPEAAELAGLRDLEWFTGGGKEIDDRVVDAILQCDSLDRLTLAYPSVSQEALRRIGTLKELTFLALPGANVNDDVVRHWCDLTSLWEVNLDDTQVSVDTIGWLSRMESLRRLSINRVPLTEAAADALAELDQISELYLAGVSMSRRNLCKVLKRRNLETLDLSGWEIDEELLGMLCSDGTHLKHLILRDNELDGPTMKRLLVATPHLYVDMGDFPDYIDRPSLEELHRRARALVREMNTGWRLMLQPRDDVYQAMSAGYIVRTGPDPAQTGEVPKLPVTYMSYLNRQLFYP